MTATRFFWAWLIGATATSIAANTAHALLSGPRSPLIAASMSLVPPILLCVGAHGVVVLARQRGAGGFAYRTAMAGTVTVAVVAFVLSFNASRDLAIKWAGYPASTAWLWPVAVDVSITVSTTALLALTRPQSTKRRRATRTGQPTPTARVASQIQPLPTPLAEPTKNGVSV